MQRVPHRERAMVTDYNWRAHELAEELTVAAGELLEHVSNGSTFTKTASSMRRVGELLMRLDGQLQRTSPTEPAVPEEA